MLPRSLLCLLSSLTTAYAALGQNTAVIAEWPTGGFAEQTIAYARANLLSSFSTSWEIGVATEALTELEWPDLSIFHQGGYPPYLLYWNDSAFDVMYITQQVLARKRADMGPLADGDGAVGDPASIGPAVLLANWTNAYPDNGDYATAAGEQLGYLLNTAPRSDAGAISQRTDQVQLWADAVYMFPPFLAYFGVLQGGGAEYPLIQLAYEQCSLYRDQLLDPDVGLWRHVALGDWQDNSHWGTGNGWAAAGMMRVLQTMKYAGTTSSMTEQVANLTDWINEILYAAWSYQQPNGTLLNTIDADPSTSFVDTASTAFLAYTTYRMAAMTLNATLIPNANLALQYLIKYGVSPEGWLVDAVNPYTFTAPLAAGEVSPEGQAFVLLLQAAWRVANDSCSQRALTP